MARPPVAATSKRKRTTGKAGHEPSAAVESNPPADSSAGAESSAAAAATSKRRRTTAADSSAAAAAASSAGNEQSAAAAAAPPADSSGGEGEAAAASSAVGVGLPSVDELTQLTWDLDGCPTDVLFHACFKAWSWVLAGGGRSSDLSGQPLATYVEIGDVVISAASLQPPTATLHGYVKFVHKADIAANSQLQALLSATKAASGDQIIFVGNRWSLLYRADEAKDLAAKWLEESDSVTFRVQGCTVDRQKGQVLLMSTAFFCKKKDEKEKNSVATMINLETQLVLRGLAAPTKAARAAHSKRMQIIPSDAYCISTSYHRLLHICYHFSDNAKLSKEAWFNWGAGLFSKKESDTRCGKIQPKCGDIGRALLKETKLRLLSTFTWYKLQVAAVRATSQANPAPPVTHRRPLRSGVSTCLLLN